MVGIADYKESRKNCMGNGERQGSGHCKPCFSIPHTGIPDDWSVLIGYVNAFQSQTNMVRV